MMMSEATNHVAVSTRVRLARNLEGRPFPARTLRRQDAEDVVLSVRKALMKAGEYSFYKMSDISPVEAECLLEKHLVSPDLTENKVSGAAMISADESVSIMINEEDHIRQQAFAKGFALDEAYKKIDRIDDVLSRNLKFSFDSELGYLTACPTNLGTGLRASVMLFLPALTTCNAMKDIIREVSRLGLTVRGAMGEGTSAEGYLYQLSNEVTLGATEARILQSVEDATVKICEAEMRTRRINYERAPLLVKDRCYRAYGILTNCALLNTQEFLKHLADVKIGVSLGIFQEREKGGLDDLSIRVKPACLNALAQKDLTETERDGYRAEYVKKMIKNLIITE